MLLHIKNISRSRKYSAEVEKMLRKFDMEQNKVLLTDFVFNALMERLVYASCLSFQNEYPSRLRQNWISIEEINRRVHSLTAKARIISIIFLLMIDDLKNVQSRV